QAMGNAKAELKQVADYVTDAIDEDGIWNACRHFSLISAMS
ncbi:MAG: HAD hydrolase family protein, partial [Lachnospiraceae bacterium]